MEKEETIKKTIEYLREGWGANCEITDYKDLQDFPKNPEEYEVWLDSRCQSCRAKEVIDFLEKHLTLISV